MNTLYDILTSLQTRGLLLIATWVELGAHLYSRQLRYWPFCLSPSLSYYESEISKIWKSPKLCCKILKRVKAKAQNYENECNGTKLTFTIALFCLLNEQNLFLYTNIAVTYYRDGSIGWLLLSLSEMAPWHLA